MRPYFALCVLTLVAVAVAAAPAESPLRKRNHPSSRDAKDSSASPKKQPGEQNPLRSGFTGTPTTMVNGGAPYGHMSDEPVRVEEERPASSVDAPVKDDGVALFPEDRRCATCALFAAAFRSASWKLFPRRNPGGKHTDLLAGSSESDALRVKVLNRDERYSRILTETMGITCRDFLYLRVKAAASAENTPTSSSTSTSSSDTALKHVPSVDDDLAATVTAAYWPLAGLNPARQQALKYQKLTAKANAGSKGRKGSVHDAVQLQGLRDFYAANGPYVEIISEDTWTILESLYHQGGDRRIYQFVTDGVLEEHEELLEKLSRRDFLASLPSTNNKKTKQGVLEQVQDHLLEPQFNASYAPSMQIWRDERVDADDLRTLYVNPMCRTFCPAIAKSTGGTAATGTESKKASQGDDSDDDTSEGSRWQEARGEAHILPEDGSRRIVDYYLSPSDGLQGKSSGSDVAVAAGVPPKLRRPMDAAAFFLTPAAHVPEPRSQQAAVETYVQGLRLRSMPPNLRPPEVEDEADEDDL